MQSTRISSWVGQPSPVIKFASMSTDYQIELENLSRAEEGRSIPSPPTTSQQPQSRPSPSERRLTGTALMCLFGVILLTSAVVVISLVHGLPECLVCKHFSSVLPSFRYSLGTTSSGFVVVIVYFISVRLWRIWKVSNKRWKIPVTFKFWFIEIEGVHNRFDTIALLVWDLGLTLLINNLFTAVPPMDLKCDVYINVGSTDAVLRQAVGRSWGQF